MRRPDALMHVVCRRRCCALAGRRTLSACLGQKGYITSREYVSTAEYSPRGLDWTGSGASRCAVALVGVPLILIVVMHFLLVGVVCLGDRHLARITALKADAKRDGPNADRQ